MKKLKEKTHKSFVVELTSLLVVSINVTNRFSLVVIFSSLMVVSLASKHFPFLIASLVGSSQGR